MATKYLSTEKQVQVMIGAHTSNALDPVDLAVDAVVETDYLVTEIPNALVVLCDNTNDVFQMWPMKGGTLGTGLTTEASMSTTKDNAATLNLYVETNEIKVQNKLAGLASVSVTIIPFGITA